MKKADGYIQLILAVLLLIGYLVYWAYQYNTDLEERAHCVSNGGYVLEIHRTHSFDNSWMCVDDIGTL